MPVAASGAHGYHVRVKEMESDAMDRTAAGLTDVGQQREYNEDSVLVEADLGLYLVCDGMGGAAAGEVASATCVEVMRKAIAAAQGELSAWATEPSPMRRDEVIALVQAAVRAASAEIFGIAEREPDKGGMGTTLAMMLVTGSHGICAHVGDSRVYLLREGEVHQLTRDHSLVEEMVREGLMSPEEAETSKMGNVITRAVGLQPDCLADTLHVEIMPGDRFIVCSDGLTSYVKGKELGEVVVEHGVHGAPAELIRLANERGGSDNITAIVLDFSGASAAEPADDRAPNASQKLDLLQSVPMFAHLSYRERMALLDQSQSRAFEAGEDIISEGERSQQMFVLLSGSVAVGYNGQRLTKLTMGSHFGEMCVVEDAPRSATITAEEPCHVLVLERDQLYALMRKNQTLAVKLLWAFCQSMAARLRTTSGDLSGAYAREQAATTPPGGPSPFHPAGPTGGGFGG
jgi:serine/threonine protein phosphatase PrpC